MLLNHSGGMKSYTGIRGYMHNPIRRDLSTQELVAEFKNEPVDFAPGAAWAYNNSGLEGISFDPSVHGHWSRQVGAEPLVTLFVRG